MHNITSTMLKCRVKTQAVNVLKSKKRKEGGNESKKRKKYSLPSQAPASCASSVRTSRLLAQFNSHFALYRSPLEPVLRKLSGLSSGDREAQSEDGGRRRRKVKGNKTERKGEGRQ